MTDREDDQPGAFDSIDHAILAVQDLPKLIAARLRYLAPRSWVAAEAGGQRKQLLNPSARAVGSLRGDVLADLGRTRNRSGCPNDPHAPSRPNTAAFAFE